MAKKTEKINTSGIKKLKILVTIVDRSKALFYTDLLEQFEVNMQMVLYGKGTANTEMLNLLGLAESEKAVILSVVREDKIQEITETLQEKFEKVKNGKGIAYTIPMKSIIGVSIYQFLSNNKLVKKASLAKWTGSGADKLRKIINSILDDLQKMEESAENGRIIRQGINTVIVGKPNAGKSSFLNFLLGEEKAIVTDIAGTTRDALEDYVRIQDISFHIIDTAGIRKTEDIVEKIGVEKAIDYSKDADLLLYIIDSSVPLDENDFEIMKMTAGKKMIVLMNKSDLETVVDIDDVKKYLNEYSHKEEDIRFIKISAKEKVGMEEFETIAKDMFFAGEIQIQDEVMITNMRHKELLSDAIESLKLVINSINMDMPEDFLTIDMMSAYESLGKIIGEEVEEDLVNEIFSKFCMGK